MKKTITIDSTVNAGADRIWEYWTKPEHITRWNSASDEWHTPQAENDLRKGGKFLFRMETKDGSMGFDFTGVYNEVIPKKVIAYKLEDGRNVDILFREETGQTHIIQTFEAEHENPIEMQRDGWQAILNNFKNYAEQH